MKLLGQQGAPQFYLLEAEMTDPGVVIVTRPEGHRSASVLNNLKHDLIFQSGTAALVDGYTAEAVFAFASALERCYEFHLRVVCRAKKIAPEASAEAWAEIAVQSERQYGAHLFLELLDVGSVQRLPKWYPTLRNRVVHRGYIPSTKEAEEFGDFVFKRIRQVLSRLTRHNSAAVDEERTAILAERNAQVPVGMDRSSLAWLGMDGYVFQVEQSFAEYVSLMREVKKDRGAYLRRSGDR